MKKYELDVHPFTDEEKEAYRLRFKHSLFRQIRALFKRRKEQGLTQKGIALRLGIDEALVSKRLRGEANLTLASLCDLARAMDARLEPVVRPLEDVMLIQPEDTKTQPVLGISELGGHWCRVIRNLEPAFVKRDKGRTVNVTYATDLHADGASPEAIFMTFHGNPWNAFKPDISAKNRRAALEREEVA